MDSAVARQLGVTFEALLLQTALQPLAEGCDAFGSFGVATLAQSIAQHDANGFGAMLAARLAHR